MKWWQWNPVTWLPGLVGEKAIEYLPWNSWGGTAHLEDVTAARDKYKERIAGWSDTETWGRWLDSDRIYALNDGDTAYAYAEDATDFWNQIAELWTGPYTDTVTSIHPDQYDKIVLAVGASVDAADTYRDNRNWLKWIGEIPPKPKDIPWWVYAGGGLILWNTIRR